MVLVVRRAARRQGRERPPKTTFFGEALPVNSPKGMDEMRCRAWKSFHDSHEMASNAGRESGAARKAP